MGRRSIKATAALAATVCAAALMAGCAPTPKPVVTPSPVATGFASDEDAFAAAEATIRRYVDATNSVDIADPSTFERVFVETVDDQYDFERKRLSQYHAERYTIRGTSSIVTLVPAGWDGAAQQATLLACLDVSDVDIIDSSGDSIVAPDRPPRQSLTFEMQVEGDSFKVRSVAGSASEGACDS